MNSIQNTCRHLYDDFIDWKQVKGEQISNWIEHEWKYYREERGILVGLAFSVISSVAAAILMAHPAPILAGVIFGVVSYIVLTPITEELLKRTGFHKAIYPLAIMGSGLIGSLFLHTICKISLTIPGAIFLTVMAFVGGQATRLTIYGEPDPHFV